MRTIISIILLTAFSNTYAAKDDLWLKIHIASKHFSESGVWVDDYGQEHPWNEGNPGLGLEYEITNNLSVNGGGYYNSHEKVSIYGGIKLHTSYDRVFAVGLGGGLVTGYEITQNVEGPVSAYIHPTISWIPKNPYVGGRPFRFDVGYVPALDIGQEGEPTAVMTFSFALKFKWGYNMLTFLAILGCVGIVAVGFFVMCGGALGGSLPMWFGGMGLMIGGGIGAFNLFFGGVFTNLPSTDNLIISAVCGVAFFVWAFWSTFHKH